jgi:ATP/maltotriose-dependent transcriptional regulator MalT
LAGSRDFIPIVLSALLGAIGHREVTLILDDVHFLSGSLSEDLLTGLARNCPPNLNLVMASRHEPWGGLYRLKVDGRVSEIAKDDLCFNREETEKLWGFFDEAVYAAAEGWVLALQSYRVASREGGKLFLPLDDRYLHRYLMEEIFKHLPEETRNFLQATAWLPELDVKKCDSLLGIQNSREILENLVRRNIFTTRISPATYRYHTLFAAFLKQNDGSVGRETLRRAMADCFARGEYEQAADYALLIDDAAFIHDCISAALGRPFGVGRYSSMQRYFDCMEAQGIQLSPRVLLARGMYLSSRGQFFEAERCLNAALPALGSIDQTVWRYAMVHKARIMRSRVSIEESSRCIDSLLPLPEEAPLEDWYLVMIEKIHNLALTIRLGEALKLTLSMMEKCLSRGSTKVKAWFERYLAVIYFLQGRLSKMPALLREVPGPTGGRTGLAVPSLRGSLCGQGLPDDWAGGKGLAADGGGAFPAAPAGALRGTERQFLNVCRSAAGGGDT